MPRTGNRRIWAKQDKDPNHNPDTRVLYKNMLFYLQLWHSFFLMTGIWLHDYSFIKIMILLNDVMRYWGIFPTFQVPLLIVLGGIKTLFMILDPAAKHSAPNHNWPPRLSVTISSGNFCRNSLDALPPGPSNSSSILPIQWSIQYFSVY